MPDDRRGTLPEDRAFERHGNLTDFSRLIVVHTWQNLTWFGPSVAEREHDQKSDPYPAGDPVDR
ncbi:MAG TPA: hypothetical protein VNQ14_02475, partial [Woeseiaceae bacterium]|nr:hypothetical protein [Woeseiaceae bacterium]